VNSLPHTKETEGVKDEEVDLSKIERMTRTGRERRI